MKVHSHHVSFSAAGGNRMTFPVPPSLCGEPFFVKPLAMLYSKSKAPHLRQLPDGDLDCPKQLYSNAARCLFPLLCTNFRAESTDPKFSIFFCEAPGKVNQIAGSDERNEARNVTIHYRRWVVGQRDLQSFQTIINCWHLIIASCPPREARPQHPESCAYHADEAVNVPFGVEQMGRNANLSLAQTHDNLFPLQLLVKLGSFLRSPRGKAAVGPALCGFQRAGRNAIVRKAFE